MNRLISKECVFFYLILLMDVLLSKGMSNIYYWEKLTFLKTSTFSERKFEEMR